jgi:hypothetical protein
MPEGVYDFPSLYIDSALDPFTQEKEYWHGGFISVGGTSEAYLLDNTPVRIRGRGNSSWANAPEKRPLRIRFAEPVALLDFGNAARDWVLLSNHMDFTLMRTHLAFYFAEMLDGMDWAPSSRLVHLYVNGGYKGVYQLADHREAAEGRVELVYDPDPEKSEYLFQLSGIRPHITLVGYVEDVDFFVVCEQWQNSYTVNFPKRSGYNGHFEYLRGFVGGAEDAIYSKDYDVIKDIIDLASFVDFYIVTEFFKNIDVGYSSVFMQVKGQGCQRRLYFGPVWDFDRSAGNTVTWMGANLPELVYAGDRNIWFNELLSVPEISRMVSERWAHIRQEGIISEMIGEAERLFKGYGEAFERNFEAHGHLFDGSLEWVPIIQPPELVAISTFRGQAEHLINWFYARAEWLDGHFGGGELTAP